MYIHNPQALQAFKREHKAAAAARPRGGELNPRNANSPTTPTLRAAPRL
jgi:hypothetical protein